jgi:AraC-like DNA-binding protein
VPQHSSSPAALPPKQSSPSGPSADGQPTASASFLSLLFSSGRSSPDSPSEAPPGPIGRVPIRVLREAWGRAVRETGDELLGLHLAEQLPPGSLDIIDYLTRSAPTLGAAFEHFIRYGALLANAGQLGFSVEQGEARFHHHAAGAVAGISQLLLALVLVRARQFTGVPVKPTRVEFMHSLRGARAEYARIFQAPVTFGRPVDALYFDSALMDLPLRAADPRLAALLAESADRMLAAVPPPDSFVSSVRLAVSDAIAAGDVRVQRIAKRLGMTARTLQRRLAELGSSMRAIVADERRRVATDQLLGGATKQQAVAQTLGYANASSLHRAMRRWKGDG